MTNQSDRQASVRAISGTTGTYEGDWHAYWDILLIPKVTFDERMLLWINQSLGTSYTELNGAMAAYAISQGVANWNSLGPFTAPGGSNLYFTNDAKTDQYYVNNAKTDKYNTKGGLLPFDPSQLGLKRWGDPNDTSTLVFPSGTNISVSGDKSGNANNFTQFNASFYPTYTRTLNNLKAIVFSNKALDIGPGLYNIIQSDFTLFFAGWVNTTGAIELAYMGSNLRVRWDGTSFTARCNTAAVSASIPLPYDTNTHIFCVRRQGNVLYASVDGGAEVTAVANAVGAGNLANASFGAAGGNGSYFANSNGAIGEDMWANYSMTPTQIANTVSYLKRWSAPTSTFRPASLQNRVNTGSNSQTATDRAFFRVPHQIAANMKNLRINLNQFSDSTTNEILIGNDMTIVEASIESNTGVVVPVTFSGSRSITVTNGDADINSDTIPASAWGLGQIPAGTIWWVKGIASFASGGKIGFTSQRVADYAGSQTSFYAAASTTPSSTDVAGTYTTTGTAPVAKTNVYAPMLLGEQVTAKPTFIGVGDSIIDYRDDIPTTPGGAGYFQRAMTTLGYGSINMACAGSFASLYLSGSDPRWKKYVKYVDYAVSEGGTNDVGAATPVATMQANEKQIWSQLKFYGVKKVFRPELLCNTASTDGWTTTVNQTPNTGWESGGLADQMNAFYPTQIGNGVDYVVKMDSIKYALDKHLWIPNVVGDGVHPNTIGHTTYCGPDLVAGINAAGIS